MYFLYYFIIYYFSFFYLFKIYGVGNFTVISGLKELAIIILFITILIKKYFRKSKSYIKINKNIFIWLFIYISMLIIASIKSTTISYIFIDLKYYLIWPLMIFITKELINEKKKITNLIFNINIICCIISVLGFYFYITNDYSFLHRRSAFDTFAIKSIISTNIDFGALMLIGVILNLIDIKLIKRKIFNIILIFIYSFMLYFSYSRSIYIAYGITIFIFLFDYFSDKISKRGKLIFKYFIITLVIITGIFMLKNLNFNSNLLSSISLIDRIQNTWPTLKTNSPLLGLGFGAIGGSSNSKAIYYVSDNNFIRVYINIGIIGLISLFGVILSNYKYANEKLILKIVYLAVGVASIFIDFFTLTPAMIIIYMCVGLCYVDK